MSSFVAIVAASAAMLESTHVPLRDPRFVLRVSDYSIAMGDTAVLSIETRPTRGAKSLAWPESPAWFFVRLAGTQHNRSAEDETPRGTPPALAPDSPGVAMVGVDLSESEELWSAAELLPFADSPPPSARVRVLRSLTALVRVLREDGAAVQDHTATSKSGQQAEIRPLMDPTTIPPGGDLPVRVYTLGAGAGGARLVASHLESGERLEFAADSKGIASFTITQPGVWAIESICVEPPREPAGDWTAAIATLSFEVPAEEGARR